jgi:hypothetical protein
LVAVYYLVDKEMNFNKAMYECLNYIIHTKLR